MTIDPEQLLRLARHRQVDGVVPLAWATVQHIADELKRLQAGGSVLPGRPADKAQLLRDWAESLPDDHACRAALLREAARLSRHEEGVGL